MLWIPWTVLCGGFVVLVAVLVARQARRLADAELAWTEFGRTRGWLAEGRALPRPFALLGKADDVYVAIDAVTRGTGRAKSMRTRVRVAIQDTRSVGEWKRAVDGVCRELGPRVRGLTVETSDAELAVEWRGIETRLDVLELVVRTATEHTRTTRARTAA